MDYVVLGVSGELIQTSKDDEMCFGMNLTTRPEKLVGHRPCKYGELLDSAV